MLLAVDVGNTNTTIGLFAATGAMAASYRLATDRDRMPDEWFATLAALLATDELSLADVDGVIISSVVPSVTTWLVTMTRERFGLEPMLVTGELEVGLTLDVDEPRQLGADRIVDCIAATERYGAPAIIIDLGTATTIDVVDRNGAYIGGAIAAGVATSLKALAGNAAQLFNVELRLPEKTIGRNTADQLRSGIVTGHVAMLEGMIARTRAEIGGDAPVIITGGLATLFVGASPLFEHYDPDLTLNGLHLISKRLTQSAAQEPVAPVTGGHDGC